MRIAVYSDIHANILAFEAVLKDIDAQRIDLCYNLGDLVDYGWAPNETVGLARRIGHPILQGNHDLAVVDQREYTCGLKAYHKTLGSQFDGMARAATPWTERILKDEHVEFLRNLPQASSFPKVGPYKPRFFHAAPHDYYKIFDEETKKLIGVRTSWDYFGAPSDGPRTFDRYPPRSILFFGHSHLPMVFPSYKDKSAWWEWAQFEVCQPTSRETLQLDPKKNSKVLVNVGSVGQPRDCDNRACYAIYDSDRCFVSFRSVEYDLTKACRLLEDSEQPNASRLALRLLHGK